MDVSNNILEFKNVQKSFETDSPVVRDFNLEVRKGEFVTLLGPSGCGKTTLLRMIGGFELPTDGQILLHGEDISNLPPNKRPINTVFQKYALFPYLNVAQNIAFGLKLKKLPQEEIDRKVRHVLEVVDLEGFEKRRVTNLSGGQQQRVAIARAIVNEPEILLLDEPLGALDYKMRREMQLELKQMHRNIGITFIYVTHDQEEAMTMSDKIVIMSAGKIQQIGTPEEVYNTPANAYVADFIGESNIFNGVMTGVHRVRFCNHEFTCNSDLPVKAFVDAVIRPEDFVLADPASSVMTGTVISCIFKGMYYEVGVKSGEYEIYMHSDALLEIGAEVGINIPAEKIHVMPNEESQNDTIVTIDNKRLRITFSSRDAKLSDDASAGIISGVITEMIYKGDRYNYFVMTDDEETIFVDDPWLWNIGDHVSILVPKYQVVEEISAPDDFDE